MDDYDIGRRGTARLKARFDPHNPVLFSGRRYRKTSAVVSYLLKYVNGFFEYHLTDSVTEQFTPMNQRPKKDS